MLAGAFLAAALVENLRQRCESIDEVKRKQISETSKASKAAKGRMSIEFRRIQEIDIKWHEATTRLGTELDWESACVTLVACCVIISRARLVGSGSGTQSASAAVVGPCARIQGHWFQEIL